MVLKLVGLRWCMGWFALALTACTSSSQSTLDSLRLAFKGDVNAAQFEPKNPAYQYLKVTVYGRPVFLVLGYSDPKEGQSPSTETWYSAKGEVLKLQGGRLVGALGLETEWRQAQVFGAPAWSEVLRSPQTPVWNYQRVRDEMPGYASNLTDRLTLTPTTHAQARQRLGSVVEPLAKRSGVRWFEETGALGLPAAVYAVEGSATSPKVVLTYQCVAPQLCLVLEPWVPAPNRPPSLDKKDGRAS